MNKKIFTAIFFVIGTLTVSAQLKTNNGALLVGATSNNSLFSSNLYVKRATQGGTYTTAICGQFLGDNIPSVSDYTFGVVGLVNQNGGSHDFGVAGLGHNNHGIGVYGSNTTFCTYETGNWAGYFNGAVKVTGNFEAPNYRTPSDERLKENIVPFRTNIPKGKTLQNVLDMNVVEFNYRFSPILEELLKSPEANKYRPEEVEYWIEKEKEKQAQRHYGLIAQELQKLYPFLVDKDPDGYYVVNYTELIPILIRSIQELKEELDAKTSDSGDEALCVKTAVNDSGNILYQNNPNPFKEKTIIRFSLSSYAMNASICIFDMTGKMLKKFPVSSSDTSVSVNGYELGEGLFLYSLIVNGQEIDTKRMLITQ